MKKVSFSNAAKIASVSLSAFLLIGATGCNKQETATPATDVNTAPDTTQTTTTPIQTSQVGSQVIITDTGFQPQKITIKVGESVTWTNNTTGTVRVASDPHPLHTGLAGFDDISGATAGDIYTFTFTKAGSFGYHDHNNAGMKGSVVVTE